MVYSAIQVQNLSKRYRIGLKNERQDTLRDSIVSGLKNTFYRKDKKQDDIIWALKDVSFNVHPGEAIGIIGRNGAGKSTLLKILSQITEPTEGRVEINGRVGSLLEVGTGFHWELTGRENIYLNGAILGMTHREIMRKFDEIVDFAGIEKFLDTPVKRYSSGMFVRLGFSVAAHLEPEILVVDEVLAVGDAQFQKKCLGKMGKVTNEGRTVLFVSHNLISLRSICTKAIWLDYGEVRCIGSSSDVISEYLNIQSSDVYKQVWEDPLTAPGNEKVRIQKIWAEGEDTITGGGFPREKQLSIGIEYWHLDPSIQLNVTLHFKVEQQVVAFTTASSQNSTWQEVAQRQGLHRNVLIIPANLLNTERYSISVLIIQDRSRMIFVIEDALVFEMIETSPRTGAWYGKEPGVMRPELPWEIHYLGEEYNP